MGTEIGLIKIKILELKVTPCCGHHENDWLKLRERSLEVKRTRNWQCRVLEYRPFWWTNSDSSLFKDSEQILNIFNERRHDHLVSRWGGMETCFRDSWVTEGGGKRDGLSWQWRNEGNLPHLQDMFPEVSIGHGRALPWEGCRAALISRNIYI